MVHSLSDIFGGAMRRAGAGAVMMTVLALGSAPVTAQQFSADTPSQQGADGGQYIPGIWVDPDGCEHWVMDDGVEGFMTPHTDRHGRPVCNRMVACGVMSSDQFFKTDSAKVHAAGRERLARFFREANANSFIISGHTDSRASDAYNLRLSENRANAVARIAQAAGATVTDIRAFGERQPVATNATAEGRAQNRRVEITCVR